MVTRKALILQWAAIKSTEALDRIPENQMTMRATFQKVHTVCRALVERNKPMRPTAAEIVQSGRASKFGFDDFPSSEQTLYNDYGELLGYWRKAYTDIVNLDAEPPADQEQLLNWDTSHLDLGSQEIIRGLKRLVMEQKRKNDALQRLITDHIPVVFDEMSDAEREVIDDLAYWASAIERQGFELNDVGLIVTSRSSPGTVIMERSVWDGIQDIVHKYELDRDSKQA
jgi:hypothetical protein